jgi:CHAT domain-containing protein
MQTARQLILRWGALALLAWLMVVPVRTGLAANPLLEQGSEAFRRGDMREAERLLEQAVQTLRGAHGERHPDTLSAMRGLAATYGRLGRHAQALALDEEVLRLRTEVLGERHAGTLQAMNNLAETFGALGRHAEQLALHEKVLRARVEVLGERHPETLQSMNNLAETYGALGRHAERLALHEKVLRLATDVLGERHPNTLQSMNNLAETYGALGRHAEQLALHERVLRLTTDVLGERHPNTLQSMNNLANTLGALGRYAERLALNERVLRLRTEVLGKRHPSTLQSMNTLAQALGALGRHAEQLALNESVLRLMTEVRGERHPDTLGSMNNLASTYGALGRNAERLALNEKVLRLASEVLGERHPSTLLTMNSLAETLGALGRHAEQLALHEKVLRARVELLGDRHPSTLQSMNNLAETYGALGRHAEQLALHEKVLRLITDMLGERHPNTLRSMNNLANTLGALGRYAERLALNERVLELMTEVLGERHPSTLQSMNTLAQALGALGRHAEQLALNESVLRLMTEVRGERHPDTLGSMNNLAQTLGALGRHAEQLTFNERVLPLLTELLGERHPSTLQSMNNLADTFGALGRHAEQLALHEKVLRLRTEVLGDRHPSTLATLAGLAWTYVRVGRLGDAAALSDRYVAGAEWQRSQPGLSPENRQAIFRGHAERYRFFGTARGLAGQHQEAFALSELGKARTLLENMAAQRASRSGGLPASEQARLDEFNRRAAVLEQQIAQATTSQVRVSLEAARNEIAREYQALQSNLEARYPKYAQLSDVKIVEAADLPGLIPADATVISYLVSGTNVSAFAINAAGQLRFGRLAVIPHLADAVEIVRRGQSSRAPLVRSLAASGQRAWKWPDGSYRMLDAAQQPPAGAAEVTDHLEVARFLGARLLQPLAKALQGKASWIISPDGPLAQLPFETLPFGDQGEPAAAAAAIHYTQSMSVYSLSRRMQQQYESLTDRMDLFAMGNPDYGPTPIHPRDRRELMRRTTVHSALQLRDLDAAWTPLPGTEAEIRAAAALFPGSTRAYLGPQATEQQLQALDDSGQLKGFRYLLFSAHGFLSTDQPALSSIVLGLTQRTAEADGYVTAAEWAGYDLRSDLTILSACDTGVGKVVSGEGVMGLPFALFVAGNVNTVLTLWPVDDQATAAFITRFLVRLKAGQKAAAALAETKREFMRHARFSHPSYWAPFVLVGAG